MIALGGEHRTVHRADELCVPVQHRRSGDARAGQFAGRHHLLRRHGVQLPAADAQSDGHVRRHLGRLQAAGQSR